MSNLRKRSGILASFLSFFVPGLGFLYSGKLRLALISIFGLFFTYCFLFWSRIPLYPVGYLLTSTILFVIWIAIVVGSYRVSKKNSPCQLNSYQSWYSYILFIVFSELVFGVSGHYKAAVFGYESFYIPSAAMSDTIQRGDYIMSDTWAYTKSEPERGDIIIFKFPENPSVMFIKRLIGIPGDKITIDAGQVLINDVKLEEPYLLDKSNFGGKTDGVFHVPQNKYFVLGDNRNNSRDSRYWGFVPADNLHGKGRFIWFSGDYKSGFRFNRIGIKL